MFQTWHLYVSMSIEQAANNLEHNLYHKSILSHESLGDYTNICFYNRGKLGVFAQHNANSYESLLNI